MTAGTEPADADLRVAFVGLGGAGQRHARVLRSLLGWNTRWLAVRSRGTTPVLNAGFEPQAGSMAQAYNLLCVPSVGAALELEPDLVVVATPTALHREPAVAALEAGCPVLVEKPLAATLADATAVVQLAEKMQVAAFVGFQRRHHPAWRETARRFETGDLGELRSVSMWCASDVTAWHPYESIDGLYALRADLGGGVIATECHEVDQLVGLLGVPSSVSCEASTGPSPGDVERSAELVLTYENLGCDARVSLSFEERLPRRGWTIEGTKGSIHWEETTGALVITGPRGSDRILVDRFGNDDLVAIQDRWVLDHRLDPGAAGSGLAGALAVSAIVEAAHRSRQSGRSEPTPTPTPSEVT